MNRRGFLKLLGSGAVLTLGGVDRALAFVRPETEVPEIYDAMQLRLAIEYLFPAGVRTIRPAYDDSGELLGFGSALVKREGEAVEVDPARYEVATYAMGHIVTGNVAEDTRLRKALFRSMWTTMHELSRKPENRGAKLVWRKVPETEKRRLTLGESGLEDGPLAFVCRMRLALEQTGWRRRLEVEPVVRHGVSYKPEGSATEYVA